MAMAKKRRDPVDEQDTSSTAAFKAKLQWIKKEMVAQLISEYELDSALITVSKEASLAAAA